MHKIFIADSSEEFCSALSEQLQREHQVECCHQGSTAIETMVSSRPDVVILDLMLPELDGLEILEAMEKDDFHPVTVITSRFYSDYMIHAMERYQVAYAVLKPCSVDVVTRRVEELLNRHKSSQIICPTAESIVTAKMYALGIPTNLAGFEQIRLGAVLLSERPGQSVTKELYPAIAAQCLQKTSASSVERNIRTAIHTAWLQRNDQLWCQYFGFSANGDIPKPTNTQFLTRLADTASQQIRRRA